MTALYIKPPIEKVRVLLLTRATQELCQQASSIKPFPYPRSRSELPGGINEPGRELLCCSGHSFSRIEAGDTMIRFTKACENGGTVEILDASLERNLTP